MKDALKKQWSTGKDWITTKEWGRWDHFIVGYDTGKLIPDAADRTQTIHKCIARVSTEEAADIIALIPEMIEGLKMAYKITYKPSDPQMFVIHAHLGEVLEKIENYPEPDREEQALSK